MDDLSDKGLFATSPWTSSCSVFTAFQCSSWWTSSSLFLSTPSWPPQSYSYPWYWSFWQINEEEWKTTKCIVPRVICGWESQATHFIFKPDRFSSSLFLLIVCLPIMAHTVALVLQMQICPSPCGLFLIPFVFFSDETPQGSLTSWVRFSSLSLSLYCLPVKDLVPSWTFLAATLTRRIPCRFQYSFNSMSWLHAQETCWMVWDCLKFGDDHTSR